MIEWVWKGAVFLLKFAILGFQLVYAIGFGRIGAILSPTIAGLFLDQGMAPQHLYAYYGIVFILAIFLILILGKAVHRHQKTQNLSLNTSI